MKKYFRVTVFSLMVFAIAFLSSCAEVMDYTIFTDFRGLKQAQGPKNVIVMIADGAGYNHVEAAGVYQFGKAGELPYEKFPVICGMSTYMAGGSYDTLAAWETFDHVNNGATDSAAAATAMSTGVKTYKGAIGVDADKLPLENVVEKFESLGKATGVVTSVEFSHATPAGFVAHNVARGNYAQIANEMIYKSACEVIFGCGAPDYDDSGQPVKGDYKYVGGPNTWADIYDDDSVEGSDADGDGNADAWTVIRSRKEFKALAAGQTPKRVLGIPCVHKTLQQARAGNSKAMPYTEALTKSVPTLAEMSSAAINVLDNDPDGFFLMIEGGAVDWASHANQSGRMIEEQIDFNKAVEAVIAWIEESSSWDQTLLIVTADHETGYLTGPNSGALDSGPVWNRLTNLGAEEQPLVQWNSGKHTNSLVPFYAKGKGSEQFRQNFKIDPKRGSYIDNTDIAKIISSLTEK
jgi:alkaline phosphatase